MSEQNTLEQILDNHDAEFLNKGGNPLLRLVINMDTKIRG